MNKIDKEIIELNKGYKYLLKTETEIFSDSFYMFERALKIIEELQNKIKEYEDNRSDLSMETTFNNTYFDD